MYVITFKAAVDNPNYNGVCALCCIAVHRQLCFKMKKFEFLAGSVKNVPSNSTKLEHSQHVYHLVLNLLRACELICIEHMCW